MNEKSNIDDWTHCPTCGRKKVIYGITNKQKREERERLGKIGKKRCTRCLIVKNYEEFGLMVAGPDGFCTWCRGCVKKAHPPASETITRRKLMAEGKKRCGRCSSIKNHEEFVGNKRGKGRVKHGLHSWCKDCMKIRKRMDRAKQ